MDSREPQKHQSFNITQIRCYNVHSTAGVWLLRTRRPKGCLIPKHKKQCKATKAAHSLATMINQQCHPPGAASQSAQEGGARQRCPASPPSLQAAVRTLSSCEGSALKQRHTWTLASEGRCTYGSPPAGWSSQVLPLLSTGSASSSGHIL